MDDEDFIISCPTLLSSFGVLSSSIATTKVVEVLDKCDNKTAKMAWKASCTIIEWTTTNQTN